MFEREPSIAVMHALSKLKKLLLADVQLFGWKLKRVTNLGAELNKC